MARRFDFGSDSEITVDAHRDILEHSAGRLVEHPMIRTKILLIIGSVLLVAPLQPEHETFGATGREYTVAARLLRASAAAVPMDLAIKSEGQSARAFFQDLSKNSVQVALILDGGPNQGRVLDSEKDMWLSMICWLQQSVTWPKARVFAYSFSSVVAKI